MKEKGPVAREVELDASAHAIYEHFYEEGWTDGLPIVPPTVELVDAMH